MIFAMKRSLLAGAVIVSGAMLAAPSLAADQPFATPFDWSGFYAGVHVGVGANNTSWQFLLPGGGAVAPIYPHGSGAFGGVQFGYNAQYGNWVFGGESDLSLAGIRGQAPCPGNPAFSCQTGVNWLGSARLRAGYAFDNVLIYGTGGLGVGGVVREVVNPAGVTTSSVGQTKVGWTAGAGAEVAVSRAWSIKAEYLYYDLGQKLFIGPPPNPASIHTTLHTGRVGINFRW